MQSPVLRPYQVGDLPRLHAIDRACFPPGIAFGRAQLRTLLEHPSSLSAVAEEAARVLGFILLQPRARRLGSSSLAALHILTIDVAPEARRQGTGALLMRWALAEARRLRAHAVELEVAADNQAAQAFYTRFSFRETGTIPGYYPGGLDAISMEMVLPP